MLLACLLTCLLGGFSGIFGPLLTFLACPSHSSSRVAALLCAAHERPVWPVRDLEMFAALLFPTLLVALVVLPSPVAFRGLHFLGCRIHHDCQQTYLVRVDGEGTPRELRHVGNGKWLLDLSLIHISEPTRPY